MLNVRSQTHRERRWQRGWKGEGGREGEEVMVLGRKRGEMKRWNDGGGWTRGGEWRLNVEDMMDRAREEEI